MVQPTVKASGQPLTEEQQRHRDEERGVAREPAHEDRTALDLLEKENHHILHLAAELDKARTEVVHDTGGARVVDRADYGDRAKLLVRHFATREAAVVDVAQGIAGLDGVQEVADRLMAGDDARRERMNRVEKMSRGVQGMYLNTAQDFDAELSSLMEAVRPQIEWELDEGIPTLRERLGPGRCKELFHSAKYVARHAPTHVAPGGPRWYERTPGLSRLVSVLHHLRDYPRATRDART